MLQIGITGGIGSGKSTVCKAFEVLHAPVYYADLEAKKLIIENEEIKNEILTLFGKDAYTVKGEYNTEFIRSKVFNNKALLQQLNQLVHPAVRFHYTQWATKMSLQKHAFVLKEAAIMDKNQGLDKIIYVYASEELRIQRTLERDPQKNREMVKSIISKQKSDTDFKSISDYIINNEDQLIFPQVLHLHQLFTS